MELSDRQKKILASVIERYISTGEPVGSKVLCEGLSVSSATVRNEMSGLSDIGYLEQPHTSAGRIPSQKGLRYYVNNLMSRYELSDADRFSIQSRFGDFDGEPQEMLIHAARLLSEITGCASVATTPYDRNAFIKRVELVPMSMRTALIVVMMSTGVVKSRICRFDYEMDIRTAELFYNIAAVNFTGRSADDMSPADMQTLIASLGEKAFVMIPLVVTLTQLVNEASKCSVITEGQSGLLNFKELEDDVYNIFECMKNPAELTGIINRSNDDVAVTIGRECMNRAFENVSVITSKYYAGGRNVGSIGVIGPLRIDYSKVIPAITYIGEIIGNSLSEIIDEEVLK